MKKQHKMEEKILEIVNAIRKHKGDTPVEVLTDDMDLRKDLDFSSFDLAELTVNVEEEFDIDIFENGLINTIGEIYAQLR